jgi:hypothetical protein
MGIGPAAEGLVVAPISSGAGIFPICQQESKRFGCPSSILGRPTIVLKERSDFLPLHLAKKANTMDPQGGPHLSVSSHKGGQFHLLGQAIDFYA